MEVDLDHQEVEVEGAVQHPEEQAGEGAEELGRHVRVEVEEGVLYHLVEVGEVEGHHVRKEAKVEAVGHLAWEEVAEVDHYT